MVVKIGLFHFTTSGLYSVSQAMMVVVSQRKDLLYTRFQTCMGLNDTASLHVHKNLSSKIMTVVYAGASGTL